MGKKIIAAADARPRNICYIESVREYDHWHAPAGAFDKKEDPMARSFKVEQTIQQQIYNIVRLIPSGKVASYGQIARIVGLGISAQMVGFALAGLKEGTDVPWQRVINSQGKISLPGMGGAYQKNLLVGEGVEFDEKGRVDLERFGWQGPGGDRS